MEVLIVDDDPGSLNLLQAVLSRAGYAVLRATDGREALAILRSGTCRLVVSDWLMPGLDGLELCRRVRQSSFGGYVYVILITGRGKEDDVVQGLTAGADDLLRKPFVPAELCLRVRAGVRILASARFQAEIAERKGIEVGLMARNAELEATRLQLVESNVSLAVLVAKLEQVNAALTLATRLDSLTGVLNRGAWTETLRLEHERARRYGHPYGLFMIDVDSFKSLNDTRGHLDGDECLRRVAAALRGRCRPCDVIGRFGGDEFVVLLPETTLRGALDLAERMRMAAGGVELPGYNAPGRRDPTISVGVAAGPGAGWEDTLKRADEALYTAKRNGRDQVCAAPLKRTAPRSDLLPGHELFPARGGSALAPVQTTGPAQDVGCEAAER